ncbi:MAG: hypothetical protein D6765_04310, partial [Bacteroidetes bacterium]
VTVGGQVFDQAGQYDVQLTAASGCDSVVHLTLEVVPVVETQLEESVCAGGSVTVGGQVFDQSGQYDVQLTAASGCDSVVHLTLEVVPAVETQLEESVCAGGSVTVGGQIFDQSGQYEVQLTAASGCDSVVHLTLEVLPAVETQLEESVCEGGSVTVGGQVFDQAGQYDVQLTAASGCDSVVHLTLEVLPVEETFLNLAVCEGDSVVVGGQSFSQAGQFEVVLSTHEGCDSTVHIELALLPNPDTLLELALCAGAAVVVGGQVFDQSGSFEVVLSSWQGCDSLVRLELSILPCNVVASLSVEDATCAGLADGRLFLEVVEGLAPVTYAYEALGFPLQGNGVLSTLPATDTLEDLPAGAYLLVLGDSLGRRDSLFFNVGEPPPLELDLQAADFNGFGVSCPGAEDGSLSARVDGGTPPYLYQWSAGGSGPDLDNLPAGTYALTVSDANGCTLEGSVQLTAPDPLQMELLAEQPPCPEQSFGNLRIHALSGGAPPYRHRLDDGPWTPETLFGALLPGQHRLEVEDANGCRLSQTVDILPPPPVWVDLGPDDTLRLGQSRPPPPQTSHPNGTFSWSGPPGLSCYDCPAPKATPGGTVTWKVRFTTPEGCTAEDEITLFVRRLRGLFVPNVFSPDGDGINDRLNVFAGPEVERIESFQVFSRWGESLFRLDDFAPNDPSLGWDGTFRGAEVQQGIYVWYAELRYRNGVRRLFKGDVLVLR